MIAIDLADVRAAAGAVPHPEIPRPLAHMGLLPRVPVEGDRGTPSLPLPSPPCPSKVATRLGQEIPRRGGGASGARRGGARPWLLCRGPGAYALRAYRGPGRRPGHGAQDLVPRERRGDTLAAARRREAGGGGRKTASAFHLPSSDDGGP